MDYHRREVFEEAMGLVAAWLSRRKLILSLVALSLLNDNSSTSSTSSDDDGTEHQPCEDSTGVGEKRKRRVGQVPGYHDSEWFRMLQCESLDDRTTKEARLFLRRFHTPYPVFVELVDLVKSKDWFPSSMKDVSDRVCVPVELAVLACLQILSAGNCFDHVSEMSGMSKSTACSAFHTFCERISVELYDKWINLPKGGELEAVMDHYDKLGLTGAMGSTDITHVAWGHAPCSPTHESDTPNEGTPTTAYEVTVDNSGRVRGVTRGFPGAVNDETITQYDTTVQRVREAEPYKSKTYTLKAADGKESKEKGAFLITRGWRYHHEWRCLICPIKYPRDANETRWSKRVESVCKQDVECLFGILRGRFRILKRDMQCRTRDQMDNMFFTCCILHNMMHAHERRGELEANVDWGGCDGLHDAWVCDPLTDLGSTGSRSLRYPDTVQTEEGFNQMRDKLIAHYNRRLKDINVII